MNCLPVRLRPATSPLGKPLDALGDRVTTVNQANDLVLATVDQLANRGTTTCDADPREGERGVAQVDWSRDVQQRHRIRCLCGRKVTPRWGLRPRMVGTTTQGRARGLSNDAALRLRWSRQRGPRTAPADTGPKGAKLDSPGRIALGFRRRIRVISPNGARLLASANVLAHRLRDHAVAGPGFVSAPLLVPTLQRGNGCPGRSAAMWTQSVRRCVPTQSVGTSRTTVSA